MSGGPGPAGGAPPGLSDVGRVRAFWFLTYVVVAVGLRGAVPFFMYPMFRFSLPNGATVTPLFLADDAPAHEDDFTDFVGLRGDMVDVRHRGYECSVEHMLHELAFHLEEHQAPAGSPPGPVAIGIGVRVLEIGPDGQVRNTPYVDAVGTARRVGP